MKFCPQCDKEFPNGERCPNDGTALIDPKPRLDPLVGTTLAGYRIIEKIARGGMGTIYRSERIKDGRPAAVKVLHENLSDEEESIKRFFREAKSLAGLKHRNIVEFFDAGQTKDRRVFIAMEFLYGQTLGQVIRGQGALPLDLTVALMSELCDAVAMAHKNGVVHRDLTPQNIIVVHKTQVKIVDFGIAKRIDAVTQITSTGMVMGTPGFLSPEQITGDQTPDPRSDIYSLGALLSYCLSGDKPYVGATPQGILGRQLTEPPTPLDTERLQLPDALQGVVNKAMAHKPADRYQSAEELIAALRTAANRPVLSRDELASRITATITRYKHTQPPASATPAFGAPPTKRATITMRVGALARSQLGIWLLLGTFMVIAAGAYYAGTRPRKVEPPPAPVPMLPITLGFTGDFLRGGHMLKIGIDIGLRSINDDEDGVSGRPLQLVALDDGGDSARSTANTITLLEHREAFALIGNLGTETVARAWPELSTRNKVLFGAVSGGEDLRRTPIAKQLFFFRPSTESEVRVLARYLIEGKKIPADQIAVFADEAGAECARYAVRSIAKLGSQARDDVEALKPAKAKAVLTCASSKAVTALAEELKNKPLIASIMFGPDLPPQALVAQVVPPLNADVPLTHAFRKFAGRYYPTEKMDAFAIEGYITARLFAMGMKLAGGAATTEQLINAIERMHHVELGIGTAVGFTPTQHVASRGVWIAQGEQPVAGPLFDDP